MMSRDWSSSIALITGASRGIGRELAVQLAELGATVWACARSTTSLPKHRNIVARACDIRDADAVGDLFDAIDTAHGRLDVLVNNASILGPTGTLETLDIAGFQETMRINVEGTFIVSKRAVPLLRASERGVILNLSSSVGRKPRAEWGAYCVSKFGVEAISGILAQELREDGIISVSVNPGGTATDMRAQAYPEEDPSTLPSAERVAETLVLLADSLTLEQSGLMYSSRTLFDHLTLDTSAQDLPHD